MDYRTILINTPLAMSTLNESQLTLVNPEPPLELVFEKDTPLNSRMLLNNVPRYQVSTLDRDGYRSEIKDLHTNELIAVIQRRHILPDVVKFPTRYDGKSVKISQWMHAEKMQDGREKWTMRNDHGTFFWRMDVVHRLILSSESSPDEPIAYVAMQPFTLVVKRLAEGFLDEIIPSFLILEQQLRLQGKAYKKAEGMTIGSRTVLGHQVVS